LRISEQDVRPMGRQASGVRGMRLKKGDHLASMEVVEAGGDLMVVTTGGYGKRTALSEYRPQGRGGAGVATIAQHKLAEIGLVAAARVVQAEDDLTLISINGVVLRNKVKDIRQMGRAARGVRMMDMQDGDAVASLARIAEADLRRAGAD
jgi:DNA gyrase subunit A